MTLNDYTSNSTHRQTDERQRAGIHMTLNDDTTNHNTSTNRWAHPTWATHMINNYDELHCVFHIRPMLSHPKLTLFGDHKLPFFICPSNTSTIQMEKPQNNKQINMTWEHMMTISYKLFLFIELLIEAVGVSPSQSSRMACTINVTERDCASPSNHTKYIPLCWIWAERPPHTHSPTFFVEGGWENNWWVISSLSHWELTLS